MGLWEEEPWPWRPNQHCSRSCTPSRVGFCLLLPFGTCWPRRPCCTGLSPKSKVETDGCVHAQGTSHQQVAMGRIHVQSPVSGGEECKGHPGRKGQLQAIFVPEVNSLKAGAVSPSSPSPEQIGPESKWAKRTRAA